MIIRLLALATLFAVLGCVYLFEGSSFLPPEFRIFHWPAMLLTFVGPMALVTVCSDWRAVFRTVGMVLGSTAGSKQRRHEREAKLMNKLSKDYYTEGPEVFENQSNVKGLSDYMIRTFDRLASRMPNADIRDLLESERDRTQVRIVQCLHVLAQGVRLTPSVGMLGTILGMVQLLSSLKDPSQIGSHMSMALLTTFYGLFFSLVFWTPMQQKVEQVLDVEMAGYGQVLRWLELLERRKPAAYFAETAEIKPSKEGKKDAA